MNVVYALGAVLFVGICAMLGFQQNPSVQAVQSVQASRPADAPHVATFLGSCRSVYPGRHAVKVCRCMATSFEGALLTDDEYALAGDILIAMARSGTNRARMQSRFDELSQRYYGRVSIPRKDAVLKRVLSEGVACEERKD